MTKLRVLLADDHRVMRDGLRMLVNQQDNMEVVGEADNGLAALSLMETLRPDVVVMDISMPELNGLKATERLKQLRPDAKILILTRHADSGYVKQLMRSGASGYVLKQSASEELVRAILRVARGQMYLDPVIAEHAVGAAGAGATPAAAALSKREEEVLRLLAWGMLSKEIAERLTISIKTVETHKANAMNKMGMKSRVDVVHYALLQGWLQDV
jgi:DNA-binding NarL/FixJ family response regulator